MKKVLVLFIFVLAMMSLASCLNITCTYEETVVPPTCTEEGYTVHTCTGCGDTYTDTPTEKVAHTYEDEIVAPTCSAEGYTKHTCTGCGDTYADTPTEKVAHTYEDEIVAPTCSAEGYTKHTCTVCGDNYNDTFVKTTAHRFNAAPCSFCEMAEITESITPDTEWYNADSIQFSITTAEQLAGLAALVNSGTDFKNMVIYLEADIDLGWYEWVPIGNSECSFGGTFNGNNHVISSLKITANYSYAGLFGNVSGSIYDFKIENASIYVKDLYENIALLCGYSSSEIKNVAVNGFVDAPKSKHVGAIVGKTSAQLTNVTSAATVIGSECVGGIAGSMEMGSALLTGISSSGTVIGGVYTGGIAGLVNSTSTVQTDMLYTTGKVQGTQQVGGIFGAINAKVGSSVYGASVCADISGEYYVGGIVGKTESVALSCCTNEGSAISASLYHTDGMSFFVWLGGYVGAGYSVDNCKNTVSISYNSRGAYVGGIAGYLIDSVNSCENVADINAYGYVGGVVGYISTTAALSLKNLKNSGNISANAYGVGGIVGAYQSTASTALSMLENSGEVKSFGGGVGGIVGHHNNDKTAVIASDLKNIGNVSGVQQVGGLFGYVLGATSSVIRNSSSSADVVAEYKVGGVVGDTVTVAIEDCSNEGSTVTATGWFTENGTDYVFLGGYAGYGYAVSGCINNADISYAGTGIYVGGIVGYAFNAIADCTNNGNIISNSSYVGGIVGRVDYSNEITFHNLVNNGDICGKSCVSGIAGYLYQDSTARGNQEYKSKTKYTYDIVLGYTYKHYYALTTTLHDLFNYGNVTATDGTASGIICSMYLVTQHSKKVWNCCNGYDPCYHYAHTRILASNLINGGMIAGESNSGELFGTFKTQVASTLTTYTVTGVITVNGEVKTGTYDVGSNTNLTLTGRTLYTPPVEEPEEGDAEA